MKQELKLIIVAKACIYLSIQLTNNIKKNNYRHKKRAVIHQHFIYKNFK